MTIDISRDLAGSLRLIIDQEIEKAGPVWTSAEVAARVVTHLRINDPELLAKWLDAQAVPIIRGAITSIRASRRASAAGARNKSASVFQEAVRKYEAGDESALSPWLDTDFVINQDQQRKRLGDMEQEDLVYAAEAYTDQARYSTMKAAFLRAIANRVGAGTVEQVFSNEDLARLWRSLA
jgi:hypothetical protein